MEQIGIRELRQHASQWIAKVRSGVAIQITDRGRPVAQLVPITTADHDREALIAGSQLIPAPNPRQPLSTDDLIEGPPLSAILDELRADR